MTTIVTRLQVLETPQFRTWLGALMDRKARARIVARITRLRLGNFGDIRPLGGRVSELRIDYGPGYRIYLTQRSKTIYLLLCGGDKRTQTRDIALAKEMAGEL